MKAVKRLLDKFKPIKPIFHHAIINSHAVLNSTEK